MMVLGYLQDYLNLINTLILLLCHFVVYVSCFSVPACNGFSWSVNNYNNKYIDNDDNDNDLCAHVLHKGKQRMCTDILF